MKVKMVTNDELLAWVDRLIAAGKVHTNVFNNRSLKLEENDIMALEELSTPVNRAVMEEAERVFQQNGLTLENAINMYLKKVADADGMQFVLALIKEEQQFLL